ncbi:MAG: tRNA (adenosine(37)-N6)-dimethylallyltransferase MiaA [Chlorobi bacterium]|nr:tRNA (adenosine(37)-N6)-dimethylallyltransferase MiaA [Chlorobiota bacterium]
MNTNSYNLVVILGPTASGKTGFAASLASSLDGEIISADSRQVYKDMTIGTGKDYDDYIVNGKKINYHLIDIVEPGHKYNLFEYQQDFFKAFEEIKNKGKFPVMCGGSGLYIESVLKKYKLINVPVNPELRKKLSGKSLDELRKILTRFKKLHNTTDTETIPRAIRAIEIQTYYDEHPDIDLNLPELNPLITGINIDRDSRRKKITERLKKRLNEGMIDEVKQLLKKLTPDDLIYYGLEYKFVTLYLTGKLSYNEMFEQLNTAIHQFAKRQMTWFRGMEKRGIKIHWLDAFEPNDMKIKNVQKLLHEEG